MPKLLIELKLHVCVDDSVPPGYCILALDGEHLQCPWPLADGLPDGCDHIHLNPTDADEVINTADAGMLDLLLNSSAGRG
jgi:hypothetical protein